MASIPSMVASAALTVAVVLYEPGVLTLRSEHVLNGAPADMAVFFTTSAGQLLQCSSTYAAGARTHSCPIAIGLEDVLTLNATAANVAALEQPFVRQLSVPGSGELAVACARSCSHKSRLGTHAHKHECVAYSHSHVNTHVCLLLPSLACSLCQPPLCECAQLHGHLLTSRRQQRLRVWLYRRLLLGGGSSSLCRPRQLCGQPLRAHRSHRGRLHRLEGPSEWLCVRWVSVLWLYGGQAASPDTSATDV
jgi:hypothetical protein